MKAQIGAVTYHVSFRHHVLPGHQHRTLPSVHDAYEVIVLAGMTIAGRQPPEDKWDVLGIVDDFLDAYAGGASQFSHSTQCFIADSNSLQSARLVSSGITYCDKRDQFCRSDGRWHAFRKAIAAFPIKMQISFMDWLIDSEMHLPVPGPGLYLLALEAA